MATFRAVLDTNIVVAGQRSSRATSPNREILSRWAAGQFTLLYSADILLEYVEKLMEFGMPEEKIRTFVRLVAELGESVSILYFHFRHYPADSDDIAFLLCAVNGGASHLITYDQDFAAVGSQQAFAISKPLAYLAALREGFVE